jgi:hypothetical protein
MRVRLRKRFSISFFALSLALLAGCAAGANNTGPGALAANGNHLTAGPPTGGREIIIGETFKIEKDERVSVKETKLTVELKGTRLSWLANGGGEYGEADVLVALDGKEQRRWLKLGDKITSGEYVVELTGVDPFGKTSARLTVTRG